jgi:membrane-associated phospholipid phosphatase
VRTSEWAIVAYFLYLLATGALLRAPARAILRLVAVAAPTCGLIALVARVHTLPVAAILRDWLPGAYVLAGYWATGLLYQGPDTVLEVRLEAFDLRVFAWIRRFASRPPWAVREVLEFAYLFCYPLVPAGVAVLYATGQRARADSYWTLVLVSAFAAYSVLPWAGTRPPRAIETGCDGTRPPLFFQRLNLAVLARGSIQVNTFPSGHAASAWAVALFMTTVPGAPWLAFAVFAAAIGAGAIAGRYHYGLDVVAGVLVAVAAFVLLP